MAAAVAQTAQSQVAVAQAQAFAEVQGVREEANAQLSALAVQAGHAVSSTQAEVEGLRAAAQRAAWERDELLSQAQARITELEVEKESLRKESEGTSRANMDVFCFFKFIATKTIYTT